MLTFESWPVNSTLASVCQTKVEFHQIRPLVLELLNTVDVVGVSISKVKVAAEVNWRDRRLLYGYPPLW